MIRHLLLIPLLVLQFGSVDREFWDAKYTECEQHLLEMLPEAEDGKEKADVYWRLSRVALLQGDGQTATKAKRECYGRGIAYADQAIQEDPKNAEGYMWHSANIGRDCLTRSLPEQAAASKKVQKDLSAILNRLGRVKHSAAWHALAELYWRHPFKSSDAAINYGRRAVITIPGNEVRLVTCILLADMLYERNWSAEKRAREAADNAEKFSSAKSNTDKYGFYDGSAPKLSWLTGEIGSLSDREEAAAVIRYAKARYQARPAAGGYEDSEYKNLQNWIQKHP